MADAGTDPKRLSLINVFFEDDCLIDTSPARPAGSRSPFPGLDLERNDALGITMASEPLEQFEERANKTPENYRLRESQVWDPVFSTGDGVLEPEVLRCMIEDAGKIEKRGLPMILEETQRSTESISTLSSDNLSLASLEVDLFTDIRASIQKSAKSSRLQNFGGKAGQSSVDAKPLRSTKKDQTSHAKLNTKPASTKSNLANRPGKTMNQVSAPRRVSQATSVPVGSLVSKPPVPGRTRSVPPAAKRESTGSNLMKLEKSSTEGAIGRGVNAPQVPALGGIHSTTRRPISSRSSSIRSVEAKMEKAATSDGLANGSSGRTAKSSLIITNNGGNTKSKKMSSAVSCTTRTPPKSSASRVSVGLASAAKHSSSTSPASSISEWSAESSSSTSTVTQRSTCSRASLEPSSFEKTCNYGVDGQQPEGLKPHGSTNATSHAKSASTRATLVLNSMRPSGLRMPSPKFDFFDGVKSGRIANANRQSPKLAKSQSRTPIGIGSAKSDSKLSSGGSRKSIPNDSNSAEKVCRKSMPNDSSNSAEKVCGDSRNGKRLSPRVRVSSSPEIAEGDQSKLDKVKTEETGLKTLVDGKIPENMPVSEVLPGLTDVINNESPVAFNAMDLTEKAVAEPEGTPAKPKIHVENGTVYPQSLIDDPPEHLISREDPVVDQKEPLTSSAKLMLSPPPAAAGTTGIASGDRRPLSPVNSYCNIDDSFAVAAAVATAAEPGKVIASPARSSLNEIC